MTCLKQETSQDSWKLKLGQIQGHRELPFLGDKFSVLFWKNTENPRPWYQLIAVILERATVLATPWMNGTLDK